MEITVTVTNNNPDTIWNKLAARLGRQPTNAEAEEEVRRILREGLKEAFADLVEAAEMKAKRK